jgi:hypothetical protein
MNVTSLHHVIPLVGLLAVTAVAGRSQTMEAVPTGQRSMAGTWRLDDGSQSGTWRAQIWVAGNDVNGTFEIEGRTPTVSAVGPEGDPSVLSGDLAGLLEAGAIRLGTLSRARVRGENSVVARFEGTIDGFTCSGRFETADGPSGTWEGTVTIDAQKEPIS